MNKLSISFLALAITFTSSQAFAVLVDDYSGDLSAYTKSVVLTNSGDDEATSLGMTDFSITAGELALSASVTNDKAYQTTFMRDDFSLDVGKRLQIDTTSFGSLTVTGVSEFGLCVAATKSPTFGAPRENYLTMGIYSETIARSVMFNGTSYSTALISGVDSSEITGFYLDRIMENAYIAGYSTATGNVDVTVQSYAGGSLAIGFYSDIRSTETNAITFDNLEIVDSIANYPLLPGVAPATHYDVSPSHESWGPEFSYDAVVLSDGIPSPSTMWVGKDDDSETPDKSGHVVYDMGSSMELSNMTIWARNYDDSYLPKDIKIFGFVDDDPTNITGAIDDIEGDANIVEVWSGTLADLRNGESQGVYFDTSFTGQYIGMRIDSGHATHPLYFQIDEVRFNSAPVRVPGDANIDGEINDADADALAANWMKFGDATWAEGDFNGDGNVDDIDATILATNWQSTISATASVPEPGTFALLLGAMAGLLVWKRR